ncbi:PIG-L deacetylase family protein [Pseudonocardia sp. CA-142604]|uniref:PIG-L deacetylase family protein n=1 Tax=Pseudonocardia sp. CA-142604 TaxID=3240024 RepID=UPI003D9450EA
MAHTLVAFHAHPDDEAVLTAGTMARATAEGHRVVLVIATDGGRGQADIDDARLGERRLGEARESARALGVARIEHLGYADSGMEPGAGADPAGRTTFVQAPVAEAAQKLAAILREETANVLLSYDRNGGYGHPDHIRAHEVAAMAAHLARTPRVLQATAPRDTLCRALDLLATVRCLPPGLDRSSYDCAYSARSEITHRISVRRYAGQKRASLRAHASQTAAHGGTDRTLATFLRIPRPLYDIVFGQEWFIDPDHQGPVAHDVFEGLP